MARGPALVYQELRFPIHRRCNTIGRRNQADAIVPTVDLTPLDRDRVVSRRHAEILVRDTAIAVVDLGARNGVFVNGDRLAPGEERVLHDSDAISFGGVALTYRAESTWPEGLIAEWGSEFETSNDVTIASNGTLSGQLHEAIENGELVLHYQPKVTLATGQLEAVECLVRWQHPERGLLYPDSFVPVAERSGQIRAMTTWVLETAVLQGAAWRDDDLDLRVAINVSTRDLDDNRLAARVSSLLRAARVEPRHLIIEVTETGLMADPRRAISNLEALKAAGVAVSIDDFGIGHSSLAYLRQLPADELKIDKSFVLTLDPNSVAILRSAISMGHDLGMRVIAEGVENQAAVELLRELGCDVGQGYHFGRPVPSDAFARSPLACALRASRSGEGPSRG